MRHRKSFNHLGRKSSHRKAMLANMATSLILNKRIKTTEAKAKALRSYVEPLITKSKEDTTHSRRVVFSYLKNKYAVSELFREVSGKVAERPGGYTRILKLGSRLGDNAEMCIIELVDFNELLLAEKSGAKETAGKRSRRGKKKTNATPGAPVEVAEATVKESGKKEMAEDVKNEEPEAKSATDKAEEKQQVTDKVEVAEEKPDKNAVEDTEKKEENSEEDATEKKE